MKTKQFQVLLDELGGLTLFQRTAVMTALKSSNAADDVAGLLEAELAKAPACGHCGAESFGKWGVATGMKRYMCKTCNRTFNALTYRRSQAAFNVARSRGKRRPSWRRPYTSPLRLCKT